MSNFYLQGLCLRGFHKLCNAIVSTDIVSTDIVFIETELRKSRRKEVIYV